MPVADVGAGTILTGRPLPADRESEELLLALGLMELAALKIGPLRGTETLDAPAGGLELEDRTVEIFDDEPGETGVSAVEAATIEMAVREGKITVFVGLPAEVMFTPDPVEFKTEAAGVPVESEPAAGAVAADSSEFRIADKEAAGKDALGLAAIVFRSEVRPGSIDAAGLANNERNKDERAGAAEAAGFAARIADNAGSAEPDCPETPGPAAEPVAAVASELSIEDTVGPRVVV